MRDFAGYHLFETLHGAVAEAEGNEDVAKRLRAKMKLRLISMSDEELWELAKLTSSPRERPIELAYKDHKRAIEECRATASEWINNLQVEQHLIRKERMPDRILVIEGESFLSEKLASTLTEAGFSVARVPDYPKALLKLGEFKPNMIIMDEALPSTDGIEACSQLQRTFCGPIVLLGRDSSGKAWVRAVEAGADFYLRKPFSNLVLVARVKAILRRYRLSALGSGSDSRSGNEW